MRIRRRLITYADIYGITYHKLAVVEDNQTPLRHNYLTTMLAAVVGKSSHNYVSTIVTFLGSNTNLNTSVLWAEGRSEGYTELECECNH